MSRNLYIHVPFCRTKCPYCDFYSIRSLERVPEYLEALRLESRLVGDPGPLSTLYIGGGTPSALELEHLKGIQGIIERRFQIVTGAEVTIEANPGDLTRPHLAALRDLGVTRISIGVQSFDDDELRFLGRRHTAAEAYRCVEEVHHVGFDQVGIDLLASLPDASSDTWRRTLQTALQLSPHHISCYDLTLSDRTPFGKLAAKGELHLPSTARSCARFMKTSDLLTSRGYEHYEVSNFALPGCRSRHNMSYWLRRPYVGLGPAAHSFDGTVRSSNVASVRRYCESLSRSRRPIDLREELTDEQVALEVLMLGLRIADGVPIEAIEPSKAERELPTLESEGLVSLDSDHVRPTRRGFLVADGLARLLC